MGRPPSIRECSWEHTVEETGMNAKLVALMCLASAAGCSTTATIRRRNGAQEEGVVIGRTRTLLVVERFGIERQILNHEVDDIDHPGNVHALFGTALLGEGLSLIGAGAPLCRTEGPAFCAAVFLPAAVGAGIAAWGFTVWLNSRNAASFRGSNWGPVLSLAPWAFPTEQGFQGGGAVRVSY
jgi:hypothetical protein